MFETFNKFFCYFYDLIIFIFSKEIVLEKFAGKIDEVKDGKAYVALYKDQEILRGDYDAKRLENKLRKLGINVYVDEFYVITIGKGEWVQVRFEKKT